MIKPPGKTRETHLFPPRGHLCLAPCDPERRAGNCKEAARPRWSDRSASVVPRLSQENPGELRPKGQVSHPPLCFSVRKWLEPSLCLRFNTKLSDFLPVAFEANSPLFSILLFLAHLLFCFQHTLVALLFLSVGSFSILPPPFSLIFIFIF